MIRPRLDSITLDQRLAALPRHGLPLRDVVTIHWNSHQVPFIEAGSDHDLAVALGVVHVHLRWTQMELMRHVAQGRLSELLGPFGIRFDRVLRTIDFPRAVPAIEAAMPAETRDWIAAFVAGVNHAIGHLPRTPPEFPLLGLRREPWRIFDVLSVARLAGADVTWAMWLALLPHRGDRRVAELWRRLVGAAAPADLACEDPADSRVRRLLLRFSRSGSNSWAVAPRRSATGGAWIASDTHLPALLPNLWLIAGYRSPGYHAAGLMVPGIPALMLGRNQAIAWGGTNLHAAGSDLFDVADLPDTAIHRRRERLRVRFARSREIVVRETAWGPLLSDLPMLRRAGGRYALRWMGHAASDEITALLGLNRARDWDAFRAAANGIGVPGQNLIYADAAGHIGQSIAAHLPRRPPAPPAAMVLPRAAAGSWESVVRGSDLPAAFDPPEGFVASANNRPPPAPVLIGHMFSASHRIERLRQELGSARDEDYPQLAALQRDTLLPAALSMRDVLVRLLRAQPGADAARLAALLAGWDGRYQAAAGEPLLFELLLYHVGVALHGRRMLRLYSASWNTRGLLIRELEVLPAPVVAHAIRHAIAHVQRGVRRFGGWGRMHRLEPRHVMAAIPLLGRCYRFGDWPADGGSDTLMKTANPLTDRRHRARLASTARHISALSDLDANWFVLLGGQDGWIGSTTLLDQTRLWRAGRYIRVPLRRETVHAEFPHRTELRP